MDSAMVYRGLDIGTAKPSAAVRARVPHHLIDILDPSEAYSAGRFARDAAAAIRDIVARGRLPLLVGGTLLYLRALREGLASCRGPTRQLRASSMPRRARSAGRRCIAADARDPAAAARIAPTDRQRIQRALEVHVLTGRPLSRLQARARRGRRRRMQTMALVPEDRAELAERIERRFDAMVAAGLVAEVRALRARGDLTPECRRCAPSVTARSGAIWTGITIGKEARRRAIVATRQLAKRQLTWLRGDRVTARCGRRSCTRSRCAFAGGSSTWRPDGT